MKSPPAALDAADLRLLRLLQADASLQNLELAERAGLSPSACHRRVKALEGAGVIARYVALLDGKAVGAGFVAYVEVRLARQSAETAAAFERAMLARGEVLECAMVTGDYDYMLKVAVEDLDAFHIFLTQGLTRLEGVANTRTVIPVKRIKETTALKLD